MASALKRSITTLVLAFAMVAPLALPASAGDVVGVVTCFSTSVTVWAMVTDDPKGTNKKKYHQNQEGAGLYLVGTGPARTFSWFLDSDPEGCTYVNVADIGTGDLAANGVGTGWSGMSVGSAGKGTFTYTTGGKFDPWAIPLNAVNMTEIWWVSAGTMLFARFKHDAFGPKGDIGPIANHQVMSLGNGQAIMTVNPFLPSPACKVDPPGSDQDNLNNALTGTGKDPKTGASCRHVSFYAVLL